MHIIKYVFIMLLGISLLFFTKSFAQASKKLESFSSSSQLVLSGYPLNTGTISGNLNYTDFTEGASSFQLNYSFTGGAGCFQEAYRTYSLDWQTPDLLDLSYFPDALSLWVKGQNGNTDILRFTLYEDNNFNHNPFESGDHIFYFDDSTALSQNSWKKITMPYTAFRDFDGSNNKNIHLNRIYAWRVSVINKSGIPHSGSFLVDDLEQITTYSPASSGTGLINGVFIQVWDNIACQCGQWDQSRWEQELDRMKNVCVDYVIINFSVFGTTAWYNPCSLSSVTTQNATINNLMAAAENKGMGVILGLSNDSSSIVNKQLIDDLWQNFGSSTAFKGWYNPYEFNDYESPTPNKWVSTGKYLESIASYAKNKNASKSFMVSPFYGPFHPADVLQACYDSILTHAPSVDQIFPQDKVGDLRDVDVDVPSSLGAIKQACIKHGRTFGVNIECFHQTSNFPNWTAASTDIVTLKNQLWEAERLSNNIITFDWSYMQPKQDSLFGEYQTYASPICNVTTGIATNTATNTFFVYPNPAETSQNLEIKYTFNNNEHLVIRLIDIMGREVMNHETEVVSGQEQILISLPELSDAVYELSINGNKGFSKQHKLVIYH